MEIYCRKCKSLNIVDDPDFINVDKNGVMDINCIFCDNPLFYDSGEVDERTWKQLIERDNGECLNCLSNEALMPAHFKAKGAGNPNSLDNLMLLCFQCHRDTHDGKLLVARLSNKFFFKRIRL